MEFTRNVFFCLFEENSVDSKYSLLWPFFFFNKVLPFTNWIDYISTREWMEQINLFFNIISQNLENLQHFVYRCHILSQCALRSGGKMFVAKVSINIWGHGCLTQEQFWKLINFRFSDCESKKKVRCFYLTPLLRTVLKVPSLNKTKKNILQHFSIMNLWKKKLSTSNLFFSFHKGV